MRRLWARTASTAFIRLAESKNVPTMNLLDIDSHLAIAEILAIIGFCSLSLMSALLADSFDLPHRDHGEEAYEEQEASEKQTEAADKNANVKDRGIKHAPARRQKCTVQPHHNDHEALKPHADVHKDGDNKQKSHAGADLLEP